jgi:hypothetical protein
MVKAELTGAIRYRAQSRLFRKPLLVMQVLWQYSGYDPVAGAEVDFVLWKDACLEDLDEMRRHEEARRAREALNDAMRMMGMKS